MKVIFLDINGVFDTYEKMDEIDSINLQRLKNIVDKIGAKVVISSSLKNSYYETGHFSQYFLYIVRKILKVIW